MASEKALEAGVNDTDISPGTSSIHDATVEELAIAEPTNKLQRWANKLDRIAGVEARGIERIPPELRERKMAMKDYVRMFTM
jgi:hypothetical protein